MSTPNSAIQPFQGEYAITNVPGLWGRFNHVRKALLTSLLAEAPDNVRRQASKISWSGADSGIHDYNGSLEGVVDGVTLSATFTGDVVDAQPYVDEDDAGEWRIAYRRDTNVVLKCYFISGTRYRAEGFMHLEIAGGKPQFEAYYLSCLDGNLRLEQVIGPDGTVYEAGQLEKTLHGDIIVPGKYDRRIPATKEKMLT